MAVPMISVRNHVPRVRPYYKATSENASDSKRKHQTNINKYTTASNPRYACALLKMSLDAASGNLTQLTGKWTTWHRKHESMRAWCIPSRQSKQLANMGSRSTPPYPSLRGDVRPFRRSPVKYRVVFGSKGYSGRVFRQFPEFQNCTCPKAFLKLT